MAGKLILVRHAETAANIVNSLNTRIPGPPLTDNGVVQAKLFAKGLTEAPRKLFCSLALRARQTAECIEEATGIPAVPIDGVHEVQVGDLEGLSDSGAHSIFRQMELRWHSGKLSERIPGGESGHEVIGRFIPVLEDFRTRHLTREDADLMVVTHGAAMRLVASTLADEPLPFATDWLDYTESIELLPKPNGEWECLRWGTSRTPFTPTDRAC